jgi:hypothetical protein
MTSSDGDQEYHGLVRGRAAVCVAVVCGFGAVALAGCGLRDGYGTLIVDPARYAALHCKELIATRSSLIRREQELRNLIDKASDGSAGTAIATMAYRTDYESVLSEEKLVDRTAAEKKCELTPTYQSDQTVR